MTAAVPKAADFDADAIAAMETAKEIIGGIRNVRAAKNIAPREALTLNIVGQFTSPFTAIIAKLANLSAINLNAEKDAAAASFMVGTTEFNIPLAIDVEKELEALAKDLAYQQGFRATVMKKLSNQRFVDNAPEAVVAAERKKLADAETRIAAIEASIAALKK